MDPENIPDTGNAGGEIASPPQAVDRRALRPCGVAGNPHLPNGTFAPPRLFLRIGRAPASRTTSVTSATTRRPLRLVHFLIEQRLTLNRLCVVDSTALAPQARKELLDLAKKYQVPTTLILFNVPLETCIERDEKRERSVGRPSSSASTRPLSRPRRRFARKDSTKSWSFRKATWKRSRSKSSSGLSCGPRSVQQRPTPAPLGGSSARTGLSGPDRADPEIMATPLRLHSGRQPTPHPCLGRGTTSDPASTPKAAPPRSAEVAAPVAGTQAASAVSPPAATADANKPGLPPQAPQAVATPKPASPVVSRPMPAEAKTPGRG